MKNLKREYLSQIVTPAIDSHKGDNGRILVIGGSELFHVAPYWAATSASKIVDMVHFTSPYLLNNKLMEKRAKENFWSGIVVPWEEVMHYIAEDDAILIGPGMERGTKTKQIVSLLLTEFPDKKWVIDGGALQEVMPELITEKMVLTPNIKELQILYEKTQTNTLPLLSKKMKGVTIMAKGVVDTIVSNGKTIEIMGGNPGLTKGGTGDVLAGVTVGLYAKSMAMPTCYLASVLNKKIGDTLYKSRGTFFDIADMIPLIGSELNIIMTEK